MCASPKALAGGKRPIVPLVPPGLGTLPIPRMIVADWIAIDVAAKRLLAMRLVVTANT